MCITELLCYTTEVNTTVEINYTTIKIFFNIIYNLFIKSGFWLYKQFPKNK